MRAALMYGAGDVRVESVPNPTIQESTDAIVRIVAGCICGSDLWPYASKPGTAEGARMGHEFVGIIEDLGSEVTGLSVGDFVIAPFVASDGTCDFCKEGLLTSCRHGAHWGGDGDGGQGEFARVPQAEGTLIVVPAGFDEKLIPSLLSLSDVMSTGYHAARKAGIQPGQTVTVIGDGAVGLSAVLSAKLMCASRIILMGSPSGPHRPRPRFRRHGRGPRTRRRGCRQGQGTHRRRRNPRRARSRRPQARD